jgi:hypothetical protein
MTGTLPNNRKRCIPDSPTAMPAWPPIDAAFPDAAHARRFPASLPPGLTRNPRLPGAEASARRMASRVSPSTSVGEVGAARLVAAVHPRPFADGQLGVAKRWETAGHRWLAWRQSDRGEAGEREAAR